MTDADAMVPQVRPALCGSASTDYAKQLQQRLLAACPEALVIDTFLGPAGALACLCPSVGVSVRTADSLRSAELASIYAR